MASDLVEAFQIRDGGLRVIATYEVASWEIEFIREDLQDAYSESDLADAHMSIIANQISSDDFREVGGFGDIDAQLVYFEEVVVFQFATGRYEGVFVSYNREDPFPVNDVIEVANRTLALGEDSQ